MHVQADEIRVKQQGQIVWLAMAIQVRTRLWLGATLSTHRDEALLTALVQKPAGATNWNGPYLKGDSIPLDPWGRAYSYRKPSERQGREYDLCSGGPNGDATQRDMICNP